jgi:hypothetical protein
MNLVIRWMCGPSISSNEFIIGLCYLPTIYDTSDTSWLLLARRNVLNEGQIAWVAGYDMFFSYPLRLSTCVGILNTIPTFHKLHMYGFKCGTQAFDTWWSQIIVIFFSHPSHLIQAEEVTETTNCKHVFPECKLAKLPSICADNILTRK